jgi:hypothetical protein
LLCNQKNDEESSQGDIAATQYTRKGAFSVAFVYDYAMFMGRISKFYEFVHAVRLENRNLFVIARKTLEFPRLLRRFHRNPPPITKRKSKKKNIYCLY